MLTFFFTCSVTAATAILSVNINAVKSTCLLTPKVVIVKAFR